jgi:hypothetical protein
MGAAAAVLACSGCHHDDGLGHGRVTGKHMDNGYTTIIVMSCGKGTCPMPYYVPPAYYLHIVNAHHEDEHQVPQSEFEACTPDDFYPTCTKGQ